MRALLLICFLAVSGCGIPSRGTVVTFEDVPRFERFEGKTYFSVSDGTESFRVFWSYWRDPAPPRYPSDYERIALSEGQRYRFTFAFDDELSSSTDFNATVTAPGVPNDGRYLPLDHFRIATLRKLEQNGVVLFDQDYCPVHDRRMEVKRVPVVYGLLVPVEPVATKFPHNDRLVRGGCVGGEEKRRPALVCGDCATGLTAWEARWFIARLLYRIWAGPSDASR